MRFFRFSRPAQAWGALGGAIATLGVIPFLRLAYILAQGNGVGDMESLAVGLALLLLGALVYALRPPAAVADLNRALSEDQSPREKIDDEQRRASANDALAMNRENREHIGRKNRAA